jgi:hypothetical protein
MEQKLWNMMDIFFLFLIELSGEENDARIDNIL